MNTTLSVVKVLLKSKKSSTFPKTTMEKCLVLGTGPSLKISLEEHRAYFLKNELLCVNAFAATDEYGQLKPKQYLMLDQAFWESDHPSVIKTWQRLLEYTTWDMSLFLPFSARSSSYVQSALNHPHLKFIFFNYTVFKGFDSIAHFFYKKNLAMPQCQNVLVAATFMAVNIGFKRIELFGADHNWHEQLHVDENNMVCIKQVHFNENVNELKYIPFYKLAHAKEVFRMDEIYIAWAKVFYGYQKIKDYATARGAKVYNASKVSFIDAFERIKID